MFIKLCESWIREPAEPCNNAVVCWKSSLLFLHTES